jgi:hypothetical protein
MNDEPITDALMRKFLLGKVDDHQRDQIESRFLMDAEARENILVAEQELVEDYVEENLTTSDRDIFRAVFAQTAEQRQKIQIIEAIKQVAFDRSLAKTRPSSSILNRHRKQLSVRVLIPIAVTLIIAIIVGIWLSTRPAPKLTIEQQLAQINTAGSLREVPSQMVSLDLSPVTVRGGERQVELKQSNLRIIELRLPWIQKERYSTYQAELRRLGDTRTYTIRNLHADTEADYIIRLRLPANILTRGTYQIQLDGIAGGATTGSTEEYLFSIAE